jgi:NAD(P)H dehydrogenase (quinone)
LNKKPIILLLGSTGQLGSLIANKLQEYESIALRVTSRKKAHAQEPSKKLDNTFFLDLDDPQSFQEALADVNRLFLLTTYSFSMVVQSKIMVDYAKKAGVEHIVHLGVFSLDKNCTVPHFAWHQMIEVYIKHSGLKWTNLHPNCFLQNLINFSLIKEGKLRWYAQDRPCGWIALEDVAEAAARILVDGPSLHHGKDYWFSTESLNVLKLAEVLTEVTGKQFTPDPKSSDQFLKDLGAETKTLDPYFYSVAESFKQIEDGRMAYISDERDDLPMLLGRKGLSVRQWIERHKPEFIRLASDYANNIIWGTEPKKYE